MITSPHNEKLKQIRRLAERRGRERSGLFAAEGEDLVDAAAAAGWESEFTLVAGRDVESHLLDAVSSLGSGTRVVGVYAKRWSQAGGDLSIYLEGVADPGNVGAIVRSAHALCDGPVVLGPGCADPFSPKAVRASMGSIFARPPAQGDFETLAGRTLALDVRAPDAISQSSLEPPLVLCLGGEREGLSRNVLEGAQARARIPLRGDGPESLGVAAAAAIALASSANRMAGDG